MFSRVGEAHVRVHEAPRSAHARHIVFRLALVLWVALLSGCLVEAPGDPRMEFRWQSGTSFRPLESIAREPPGRGPADRELTIRGVVPRMGDEDPALDVSWPIPLAFVAIGGRHMEVNPETPGLFPLHPSDQGKPFELHYRGEMRFLPGPIHFGSQRELWLARLRSDLPSIAVGALLAAGGILCFVLSLRRHANELRALAFFGLCAGGFAIGQSPLFRAAVWGSATNSRLITAVFALSIPVGLTYFVTAVFGDTRSGVLRRVAKALVVVGVVEVVLHLTRMIDIAHSRMVDQAFLFLLFVLIVSHVLPKARAGERGASIFLIGLVLLLTLAIPDFSWGFGRPFLDRNTAPFGLFAFTIALGFVARSWRDGQERALIDSRAALQGRVEELEIQRRDIEILNDELRRQIEKRSRELGSLLTQTTTSTNAGVLGALARGSLVDDRYRVLGELGRGAMGAVYDVERTTDGKRFALKVMTGAAGAEHAARFAREAEVAARVKHENVVAIVDVGIASEGFMFLVMERVTGRSLEEARASFGDVGWGVPILLQIVRGLGALHDRGVVHRDIKPSNVLLEEIDGAPVRARVADLGVARDLGDALPYTRTLGVDFRDDISFAETGAALTAAGAIVGTPLYLAPELATGSPASPASDVFAFGILAYEVLTGSYPFATPPLLHALTHGSELEVTSDLGALAAPQRELLRRSIAWDPEVRPSARQLETSLNTALEANPSTTRV